MNTAWTSSNPVQLQVGVDNDAYVGDAPGSNRLSAPLGAQNATATFQPPAPLDLSSFDELRFWIRGGRPADGGGGVRKLVSAVRIGSFCSEIVFTHPTRSRNPVGCVNSLPPANRTFRVTDLSFGTPQAVMGSSAFFRREKYCHNGGMALAHHPALAFWGPSKKANSLFTFSRPRLSR
jgi:hypothetical protein